VTSAERAVLQQLDRLADEMVAFTRDLVRVPTINPPGARYADCARVIATRLSDLGYAVDELPAVGLPEHTAEFPRINVVGRLGSPGAALHFNGHYDVVPPGAGWTVDPFGAEVRDGRLYGRGTCDQKAGIAASLYAVEAVRRAGITLRRTIEQSATPDEESGGFAGVAWLCDRGVLNRQSQRWVVITEPLDPDRVCVGHRGAYWFELTTIGRVGHGSMPNLALNAAEQMARLIRTIDTDLKPALATRSSGAPVEPPQARAPSINLNAIHAGQPLTGWQTPTVPDRCTAVYDRRFIHEETFETVRAEIVALLDATGVAYELRDLMRVDPVLGDADGELPRAVAEAIRQVTGRDAPRVVSPGTYDHKHVLRRAGIDACVAYGPGRLTLAHQPDEYVALDDLLTSARVLALLTLRLAA
jgi:succinyl-diaminopimelate desuccinylase